MLLLSGALGCAGGLRSEAEGGMPWREVRSPHFTVRTDADAETAKALAQSLEEKFFVLGRVAFPYEPEFEGSTEVAFFSSEQDLGFLGLPADLAGFHSGRYQWFTGFPTIVLTNGTEAFASEHVVTHELVHRFVAFHMPQAPTWLNEGLAKYFETLRIEGGELVLGENPLFQLEEETGTRGYRFSTEPDAILGAPALRRMKPEAFYEQEHKQVNYLSSWSLVSAFMSEEPSASFRLYLDALQSGSVSEQDAWQNHMRRWDTADTRQSQLEIFSRARAEIIRFKAYRRPSPAPMTDGPMSPASTHALWARLVGEKASALDQARKAVALDPRNPEGLFLTCVLEDGDSQARFKKCMQAYEASGRSAKYGAAILHSFTSSDLSTLDPLAARLSKTASTSNEFEALGNHLYHRGRTTAALRYAKQAAVADPSNARAYSLLARLYAQQQNYRTAVRFLTWAINLGDHGRNGEELALLREYQQKEAGQAPEQAEVSAQR